MTLLHNLVYLITSLGCITLAIVVWTKNKKSPINKYFALYAFGITGWIMTLYLLYIVSEKYLLMVGRTNFVVGEFIAYFAFMFGYWFPKKTFNLNKKLHISIIAWTAFLIIITWFTDLIDKNEIITEKGLETVFGDFYFLFVIHLLVLFSAIIIFPLYKYKKVNRLQKLQIKYFTLGTFLSILFIVITNIVLPFVFSNFSAQLISPVFCLFLLLFTSYSIVKHSFMDIKVVIQRGLIYSSLLAIIVGTYLILLLVLGTIFHITSNVAPVIAGIIITIVGIFTVPIIEIRFRKLTDKIFFKNKYDYSQSMYEVSEILNKNIDLKVLIKNVTEKLNLIFHVQCVGIITSQHNVIYKEGKFFEDTKDKSSKEFVGFFRNSKDTVLVHSDVNYLIEKAEMDPVLVHSELPYIIKKAEQENKDERLISILKTLEEFGKQHSLAVTIAIALEERIIGIITMGDKLSGDQYTKEDINLLKTISYQAAVAIEKAQLYDQVKEYSQELERKVVQRTGEIKGLQEEQQQMMLEISHGLQTPLTIIKGELESIAHEVKDKEKLLSLERSINRVSKFIYNMLRLSKLEVDGKNFKKDKLDLSEQLLDSIESLQIISEQKGIKIAHTIAPDINIQGDKNKIDELTMNLVSNSVKYMRGIKNKKINISLTKKRNKAELVIEDNGIGISNKHLPLLFSKFYRIKDDAGAEHKGTGLGLAICKEIVEGHDGRIKVESEIDKGTKIIITLPII